MFERILVPIDASALTADALDTALRLADPVGGSVTLLRIHAEAASLDPDEVKVDLAVIEGETDALRNRAVHRAAELGLGPPRVEGLVRAGPLASILLESAEELRATLIVMGTHGRKGMADQLLGSTAERVVAAATCSVLVVKPAGFPFLRD